MPMMTDAANEKIARRDMITCPSKVAEKAHSSSPPTRRFGTGCAREPQPAAAALRPVSFASLI